jgi:DNA-binding MarR family transcriptional regulator/N-acetylglutamate synthase-like GNAT family acetyltransferase
MNGSPPRPFKPCKFVDPFFTATGDRRPASIRYIQKPDACTLLPYDPRFEPGTALAQAKRAVALNHPHCASFASLAAVLAAEAKKGRMLTYATYMLIIARFQLPGAAMDDPALYGCVAEIRRFNRFYTQKIGALHGGLLGSLFSLTEARLLYELAHHDGLTAARLGKELGLDPGYLSRLLRGFERRGLLRRTPSVADRRQSLLSLTEQGRVAYAPLDAGSREEVCRWLRDLTADERSRLVAAMRAIERLLGTGLNNATPYLLRPPRPGDMGWVIGRHGALYAEEYGWNTEFESLVAEIVAKFMREFDAQRECCWIAEKDGCNTGSAFLVAGTETAAQLRLLLVEPRARGLGIGERLVAECLHFARKARYRSVSLWTNSVLLAARRLYAKTGFRLVDSRPHRSFGQDLVGETWELTL